MIRGRTAGKAKVLDAPEQVTAVSNRVNPMLGLDVLEHVVGRPKQLDSGRNPR